MGMPISKPILTAKAKILYKKLYSSSDSSVIDMSDNNTGSSVNSVGTSFKAISGIRMAG